MSQKYILGLDGGREGTDKFYKWFRENASSFFSQIPCHPGFANGLQSICEGHDALYTEVGQYISGDNTLACTVAHDIYH